MKLKNILLVVEDIERSQAFYRDLFGLKRITDLGGNIILTEGLVLQDRRIWQESLGKEVGEPSEVMELYFEENNLDSFLIRLETYPEPIRFLHPLQELSGKQRIIRLYDPDGHLLEVREIGKPSEE